MDEASALIAVSEIAVAVAGFSGVATALGNRDNEEFWSSARRILFTDLLAHSAIALFTSLLALLSIHAVGESETVWGGWSLLWASCAIFGIASGVRRNQRFKTRPRADRIVGATVLTVFGVLLILQILNVVVLGTFWPYLAALVGNLAFGFVQFVRLILPRSGLPLDS